MPVDYSGIQQGINQGYDYQRQKAQQSEAGNLQGQRDALSRRAAALGGGPSGAFVKQEQLAGDASAQRLQDAYGGINQAQAADNRNLQMTQLGQQYQTSEREAGQQFQQGLQQSQFGQQEKLQGEQFGQQSGLQKAEFGQQSALQQGQQQFAAGQSDLQRQLQSSEFGQQMGLSQQQFAEQTGVDQFNEGIAQQMANKKDMLENLFGNFSAGKILGADVGLFRGAGSALGSGLSGLSNIF